MTAVIDSNVLVSALLFGGLPEKVVQAALGNDFVWVTSAPLQREFERVLRDKFHWPEERVGRACQTLWNAARVVVPEIAVKAAVDPDDNAVLECAVEAQAGAIVTGDNDLLRLNPFRGMAIVTPSGFLRMLQP